MGLAAAALLYAGIAAVLFRNLLPDLTTHLFSDLGDPLLNVAIVAWNARQVPLTDAWWNFPSYAPLPGVTAFTEHLLLTYPIASPVVWLTGNPILAHNIVFLVAMPLNGLAAFALARELTASSAAAFIAGLAFAFAPYQSVHLSHVQMMLAFGMPLSLLGLHRYLATRHRAALALFAAGWLITALSNAYLLVLFPLLVVLWCAWFVRPREWTRLIAPAAAALVATVPVVPLLWGYHVRQAAYGFARAPNEIHAFAADVIGLVGMYHRSMTWRGLLPHDVEEGALFPGFTILALAGIALWGQTPRSRGQTPRSRDGGSDPSRWPRRLHAAAAVITLIVLARVWTGPWGWHLGPLPLPPFRPYRLFTVAFVLLCAGLAATSALRRAWSRRDTVMFLAVAVFALWLLALGPFPEWSTPWRAIAFGPYYALMQLPGVDAIRVPARAWLPAVLCLAMLAGYGAAYIERRFPRRSRLALGGLAIAIVAEGWFFDGTKEVPAPMRAGAIPQDALVLDLPMEQGFWNAVPQYRAVLGGYRTINGYSGYEPRFFTPLRRAISDLRPDALDEYRRLGDLYVIVRPGLEPPVARWIALLPRAEALFDVGDARIYRLPRHADVTEESGDAGIVRSSPGDAPGHD